MRARRRVARRGPQPRHRREAAADVQRRRVGARRPSRRPQPVGEPAASLIARPQGRTAAERAEIARFVAIADELTPPSFAAYLDIAVHSGMRPGELDALRWWKIDFQGEAILVDEKWCPKTKVINAPKHHHVRTIALTEPARDRLLRFPRESEFVFTTLNGTHYKPTSRISITGTASAPQLATATLTYTRSRATASAGTR
jgi:integrase